MREDHSMTPDQLPLGQTFVMAQTNEFRNTVTRISQDSVEAVWYDQATNDPTLTVHAKLDGSAELVQLDRVYWKISVNGRPATEQDLNDLLQRRSPMSFGANPSKRELEIRL